MWSIQTMRDNKIGDTMTENNLDEFWATYEKAAKELEGVKTTSEVVSLCHKYFGKSSGNAFFPGGSGDVELLTVLLDSGWRPVWIEAVYYFAIREPGSNAGLTYVEGDIYYGIQKRLR